MRGLKLNETLERVADLLADRLDLSVDQLREIAGQVDGIERVEEKNEKILEIAAAIPRGQIHPMYLPEPDIQPFLPNQTSGTPNSLNRRLRN